MFDPERTNEEIELTDEDCRASLTESEAIGTSFAIPACFDSIRYFEVVVETNRGGIFVGWSSENVVKQFSQTRSLPQGIGSRPETWAFDSYTGSVGTAGRWKPFAKRKIRPGDTMGCLLDTKRGKMTFFLDKDKYIGDAFTDAECAALLKPGAVFYASLTLKYKGTTVLARFAPPFVHQSNLDSYLRQNNLHDAMEAWLPVSSTHPELASHERLIAEANLKANRASCALYQIPEELLMYIFSFLSSEELSKSSRTSRLFRCVASENELWSAHLNNEFGRQTVPSTIDAAAPQITRRFARPANEETASDTLLSMYQPNEPTLYSRFRVLTNWARGRFDSKRNFWCNSDVNCVSANDRYLACGTDGEIVLFDIATGSRLEPTLQVLEEVLCVDLDSTKIVASGSAGTIFIYDADSGQLLNRMEGHRKDIEAMSLIRDSPHLLTGSWHKDIKFWDLEADRCITRYENAHSSAISCVRWLDKSSPKVFASASYEPTVKFWDTRVSQTTPVHSIGKLHIGAISAMDFSEDGTQMVTGGEDASIKLVELRRLSDPSHVSGLSEDGMWLQQYRGHSQTIKGLFFEKGGRLVSGSTDCSVRIWNQRTAKASAIIPTGKVSSMQCNEDVLFVGLVGKRATMFDFRAFKSDNSQARRKYFASRRTRITPPDAQRSPL